MVSAQALTSNGWQHSYFIIDSGASISLFSPEVCKVKNVRDNIVDFNGTSLFSQKCTVTLSFAEKTMNINGNIIDYDTLPKIDGKRLSGILGADFFTKNHIVLDFYNKGMYLGETCISNDNPFIPIKFGLSGHNIPAVFIDCNNRQFPFVLDTGATDNMVAPPIFNMAKDIHSERTHIIKGLASRCLSTECELDFSIYTYSKGIIVRQKFHDAFISYEPNSISDSSLVLDTFHGLIGNDFIHSQKWIIDFSERKIFKNQILGC